MKLSAYVEKKTKIPGLNTEKENGTNKGLLGYQRISHRQE